jgi:hypothetical protein
MMMNIDAINDRLNSLDREREVVLEERPRHMKSLLSDIAIETEELEDLLSSYDALNAHLDAQIVEPEYIDCAWSL